MKEYVELTISDSSAKERINPLVGKQIHFSDTGKMKYGWSGKVQKWLSENILLLETQLYYDGIKMSQFGPGLQLGLYEDYKLSKKIGSVSVERRWYQAANKDSWKREGELSEDNSTSLVVELEFSNEEKSLLALGITPLQMEDKWFCYMEADRIYYYRSWTGIPWFQAKFSSITRDRWRIVEALAKKDWDLDIEQKKKALVARIESHLRWIKRIVKE
ncbi:MAG: hypothetical protein HRU41_04495 [Saprospiraceae bacterium]|nr:hypothetical protein [Saprospiraceae bacterium]